MRVAGGSVRSGREQREALLRLDPREKKTGRWRQGAGLSWGKKQARRGNGPRGDGPGGGGPAQERVWAEPKTREEAKERKGPKFEKDEFKLKFEFGRCKKV